MVTLPEAVGLRIKALTEGRRKAFGSLRVTATVGEARWRTSIWADAKSGVFHLPLKADVRRKCEIAEGDEIEATVEIQL